MVIIAFQILYTNVMQTAVNAAAQVTAALINAGDEDAKTDPQGTLNTISEDLFEQLKNQADEDNEKLREEDKSSGGSRSDGGAKRGRKGGGPVEDDGSMEMTWGAFKGLTIAEIYELDKDECDDYDYGGGKKSGRDYVNWLSKNKDNEYTAKRAAAFIKAKRDAA